MHCRQGRRGQSAWGPRAQRRRLGARQSLRTERRCFAVGIGGGCKQHAAGPETCLCLGNATPTARNLVHCHGTGETVPFMNRTFEWGVGIATFLPILSIVPRHCARFF